VPFIIVLIALCFGASAFLLAISLIPQKSEVTKRLEELEGVRFESGVGNRAAAFERIFNDEQRGRLKQQLMEAGWYTVTPAQIGVRVVGGAFGGLSLGLAVTALMGKFDDIIYIAGIILFTFGGGYLPFSRLKAAIAKRKKLIQRALPDLLDMLSTTVQAGLAFNAALNYSQEVTTGPLAEEIKAALSEIRLGRSRADALKSMAGRVRQEQLSTTVSAVVQAERLGSNLASVLEELADETRNRRMIRAEEIANLRPTKMVLPMALFMLPALFVMIFGGVVAEYYSK
jgi:tight adherence protein C